VIASGVFALPYDDSAGFTAPPAFGPYRVLHQIGSGALGPVFRAIDAGRDRLVAIKAFRLDIVPESAARLADQLRQLAGDPPTSDRIVPVCDAGLEGMTPFLAYEFVQAETLDLWVRGHGPMSLGDSLPWLTQIADAIEAAASAGHAHGALHPRDIFVVDAHTLRIGGFGVATALEGAEIPVPARRPYAAPERSSRTWDGRADVFALGVIAHEMLTGRRPSGAGEQDGALPASTSPAERVVIRRALAAALHKNPARRLATPSQLIDALHTVGTPGSLPLFVDLADEAAGEDEIPIVDAEETAAPELARVPDAVEAEPVVSPPLSPAAPVEPVPVEPVPVEPVPDVPIPDVPLRRYSTPTLPPVAPVESHGMSWGWLPVAVVVGMLIGYWGRGAEPPAEGLPTVEVGEDLSGGTEVPVGDPSPDVPPEAAVAADGADAAAAPAPSRGRMLVRSVPSGARVMISGRLRGTTPAAIRDLPFGTYNVTVSREGYQSRVQRVTVSRTVPARDITVELRPDLSTASGSAVTGAMMIETRPAGAEVRLDGRLLGTTPMRVPGLSPGTHTIQLDLAGHKSVSTTVAVRAGQLVPVRVSLEVK
jgi:serine/threonine-protein kinase